MMSMGQIVSGGVAAEVEDVLERWIDWADIDGFNLQRELFSSRRIKETTNDRFRIHCWGELQGRC
jgi:hypothetical protein